MEKAKVYLRKARAYLLRAYDDLLPEPEHKVAFWAGGAVIFTLFAFLIAALDIGIRNKDCSIIGMIALYIVTPGKSFPWMIWLLCSVIVLSIAVFVAKAMSGTEEGRNFKLSESDISGSSKDISDEELRRVCEIAPPEDTDKMILGMAPNSTRNVLGAIEGAMDNPNIAIIGTPGAGKSAGYCIPFMMQIMRRRESVVCSDTKGELFARTAESFRANGYVVKKLDLRNPIMSNGWNVLKEMRYDQARAQVFVNTIISNCAISENYVGFAANLLNAISLYVERNPEIPEEEKTLAKVYQMISIDAENLDTNFKKAKNVRELVPAVGAYSSFERSSTSLAGNVINNLSSALNILAADAVQEMLKKDEIDLTLPGQRPCVYYVVMSDQDDTFKFLASLFFAFLFQDLVEFADQQDNQRLPVQCTVLLEEFAQVKIPNIDKKLSTCRSRGVPIIMIMQTLNQLMKEYRYEWETMLDTCAIQICLAANGETTAKYFEKKTGETTAEVKTEQHDVRAFWGTGRYSTGYGKRYYRTADEIRRIPRYHSLIVWQRYNTLITKNFVMDKHPAYPYMDRTSSFTSVPLTDLAAREYIRKYEENRIQVMDQWIQGGGRPMWYCSTPKLKETGPNTGKKPPKFLSYRKLEQQALQYSREHPEINQRLRRQIEERRLEEARRLKREMDGNPIFLSFVDETPMKYEAPPKPKKKKNEPDPNQINKEEYQQQTEAQNAEAEPADISAGQSHQESPAKEKEQSPPNNSNPDKPKPTDTEKKHDKPATLKAEPFNEADFMAKYGSAQNSETEANTVPESYEDTASDVPLGKLEIHDEWEDEFRPDITTSSDTLGSDPTPAAEEDDFDTDGISSSEENEEVLSPDGAAEKSSDANDMSELADTFSSATPAAAAEPDTTQEPNDPPVQEKEKTEQPKPPEKKPKPRTAHKQKGPEEKPEVTSVTDKTGKKIQYQSVPLPKKAAPKPATRKNSKRRTAHNNQVRSIMEEEVKKLQAMTESKNTASDSAPAKEEKNEE